MRTEQREQTDKLISSIIKKYEELLEQTNNETDKKYYFYVLSHIEELEYLKGK